MDYYLYQQQGVSHEEKKFCVLHEWGNKIQLGVKGDCEPVGSVVDQGAKPLENLQNLA